MLALRRELELLDEVLNAGPTPLSARAALDRSFFFLRTAERAWRRSRQPGDLMIVVRRLEGARAGLDAALDALRRRAPAARPPTASARATGRAPSRASRAS